MRRTSKAQIHVLFPALVFATALAANSRAIARDPAPISPPPGGAGDVSGSGPSTPSTPRSRGPDSRPPAADTPQTRDGTSIDLRPRFASGKVTRYVLTLTSEQKNTSDQNPDLASDQRMEQILDLGMKVIESSDQGSTIEIGVDRVRVSVTNDTATGSADSAAATARAPAQRGPGTPPRAETPEDRALREDLQLLVSQMATEKMTVILDTTGKITHVSGGQKLAGGDAASQLLPDAGLGGSSLGGLSGNSGAGGPGMLQWLISGASGQPERARLGESWTNSDNLGQTPLGSFSMRTKHTVRSIRGNRAEIKFDGSIETSRAAGSPSEGGAQISDSTYSGTYTWDADAGQLVRMDGNLRAKIAMTLLGSRVESTSTTRMSCERTGTAPRD